MARRRANDQGVQVTIDFERPIPADLAGEIHKKIYYLSEDILSFSLVRREGEVGGIELILRAGDGREELVEYIRRTINSDVEGIKSFRPRRVWDADDHSVRASDRLLDELRERQFIHVHGEGQIGITGPVLDAFQFFDATVRVIGQAVFGAEVYQFPTLITTAVLETAGYLDWFPHFLMFVSRMRNDMTSFEKFKAVRGGWGDAGREGLSELTCETGYNAPPTMCYYVYDTYRGRQFARDRAVTMVGKVFRYENKYHDPLTRLWDFSMREVVFLGSAQYVKNSVEKCRRIMTGLMEELGLKGFCETANDPFFLTSQTPSLINAQLLTGAKHELKLRLGPEQTVAVASFNLHGQFIAKRFDLQNALPAPDEHIFTGCFAVGLERLTFAFLTQFGTDVSLWPSMIRDQMEVETKQAAGLESRLRPTFAKAEAADKAGAAQGVRESRLPVR